MAAETRPFVCSSEWLENAGSRGTAGGLRALFRDTRVRTPAVGGPGAPYPVTAAHTHVGTSCSASGLRNPEACRDGSGQRGRVGRCCCVRACCSARIRTPGWPEVATGPRLPVGPPGRGDSAPVGVRLPLGPVLGLGAQTGDAIVWGQDRGREELATGGQEPCRARLSWVPRAGRGDARWGREGGGSDLGCVSLSGVEG